MAKKCVNCKNEIEEEFGKLQGTMLKVKENEKNFFVYVCSTCQKQENWIETAKVKAV